MCEISQGLRFILNLFSFLIQWEKHLKKENITIFLFLDRHFNDHSKSVNGSTISTAFSTTTSSSVSTKPFSSQTTTSTTPSLPTSIPSLLANRTIAPKPSQTGSPSVNDLKTKISSKLGGENQPLSEKKRGPGRPPGSTKHNLETHKTVHTNGDMKSEIFQSIFN